MEKLDAFTRYLGNCGLFHFFDAIQKWVLVFTGIIVFVLTIATVFLRYVLTMNVLGLDEIILLVIFWQYFIGAAQGSREEILAAAGTVPGLTNLTVTEEKGGEVSFTAVSTEGTDLRGSLSQALAGAGCPVLDLRAETMSLEDVFLQLTETPQTPQQDHTKEGDEQ